LLSPRGGWRRRRRGPRTGTSAWARRSCRAPGREALQHEFRDRLQRLEHAAPVQRVAGETRYAAEIERVVQVRGLKDQLAREVLLVVLQHERQRADVDAQLEQVALEVLEALEILIQLSSLAVGDEYDAVRSLEHEAPRRIVVNLAGDRVQLEPRREAGDLSQIDGEEVEEQRAVGLRRERHHAPASRLRHPAVHV